MRMRTLSLILISMCLAIGDAAAVNLRLMTGNEQGTYYRIGHEIAEVCDPVGLNLQVLPSAGSWANITALFNNDTEFAILQIDAFIKAARNLYANTGKNIYDEIKVVTPLYFEEIHVLKREGRELDFAAEQIFAVGCGPQNGGSCLSAEAIASFYGKTFSLRYGAFGDALADLKAGRLDLVILTSGKPSAILAGQEGLDLVALPRTRQAVDIYLRTTIGPGDYAWLDREVETYGVRSVLATMIQEEGGLANNIVGTLHFSLQVNQRRLKENGHPKWRDVLFTGYNEKVGHEGVQNAITACQVIRSYGYDCADLAAADPRKGE